MQRNLVLTFIVYSGMINAACALILNSTFDRDVNLDGYIDDTNVLRTTNGSSLARCALSCNNDPNCRAFYVNPTTGTCQEQSALSNADMIGLKTNPGFRYYRSHFTPPDVFECPVQNGGWGAGRLPDGFTYLFKIFNDLHVNHSTAFGICKNIGANLPKIYEVEKMDFYLTTVFLCPDVYGYEFWVDGTNLNATNKSSLDAFTTHDGIVIPQIPQLWYTDRPNGALVQNCIQSSYSLFGHMFDDCGCDFDNHQVLCEKKITN